MIFVCDWDVKIIAQWEIIENLNSTISIDPKLTENLTDHGVNDLVQLMCMSRIEANDRNVMMQYAAPDWIDKKDTSKPQLMSQLVDDFNFGECKQVKEVRNDP